MPKEPDIIPGQAFHLPAVQDVNIDNLLKIFGSKEATAALTELAKTESETWTDIKDSITKLNDFIMEGGAAKIIDDFKETVDLQIADALSDFTNEIKQAIADTFSPLKEAISTITNDITQFISEELATALEPVLTAIGNMAVELSNYILSNPTGAIIGGTAGAIAGLFLPGGAILVAIGALIGSIIEDIITGELAPPIPPGETGHWVLDPIGRGWIWVPDPTLPPLDPGGPSRLLNPEEEF